MKRPGPVPPTIASEQPGLARRLKLLVLLLAQLALAWWVVHAFDIEGRRHFPAVFGIAIAGFFFHYWFPPRGRMPLFVALSAGSVFVVLPWQDAAMVLGLGLMLIAITWLPASVALRVALLLLVAGNLAVWRSNSDRAFWPILAAMFMFRLVLYMFDTREGQHREVLPTLSYFFLLPNACFTLFPVVDYSTFRRTYYDGEEIRIYQTGLHWICQGLLHLLLYRWIKYHVLPAPHELRDLPHLALFLAANYALYLHVSGQFHLITGILHLFGFRLPRTHYWFFLATSFTDIWRRINIYWKDFMQKVFFLPVFFRVRRWGNLPAMLAATAAVFVATWLLHSYQTFWLLGEFPITRSDAVLWLGVGLVVAVNALFDVRRARREAASPPRGSLASAAANALRALGMFAAVSLFWGQWTHPWLFSRLEVSALRTADLGAAATWLAATIALVVTVGVLFAWFENRIQKRGTAMPGGAWRESPAVSLVALLAMALASQPQLFLFRAPHLAEVLASLKHDLPTPLQASQLVRGYYEDITEASLQSQAFSNGVGRTPIDQHVHYSAMTRTREDMLELELIPNWKGEIGGAPLTVNAWGMRDRDLPQRKPPHTYRVALVGSSVVMGYGVRDEDVFKVLLEQRLNAEQQPGRPRIELLNFGVGRYYAIHRWLMIHEKVFGFQPDALYYFAHQDELMGPPRHLASSLYNGYKLPFRGLEDVLREAGVSDRTSWGMKQLLLDQNAEPIVLCTYRDLAAACRLRGVLPVWIYLPIPGIADAPPHSQYMLRLAARGGFATLDLTDWAPEGGEEVKLNPLDHHANALGHRLIAERLQEAIRTRPELLPAFATKDASAMDEGR